MFKKILIIILCICSFSACSFKSNEIGPFLEYEMKEEYFEYSTEDGLVYYCNKFVYPHFKGDSIVVTKLNKRYDEITDKLKEYKLDSNQIDDVDKYCGIDCLPFYNDFSAEVTYNDKGYISIYEIETKWSGGAHAYNDYYTITMQISTGEEMTADHFIIGTDDERLQLSEKIREQEHIYTGEFDFYDNLYALVPEGIRFYIWEGDAIPLYEITIPYTDKKLSNISANKALKRMSNN